MIYPVLYSSHRWKLLRYFDHIGNKLLSRGLRY
ncbi:MAG: hypothetical protein RL082_1704, partial [Pseudomonadota bacterium]